MVNYPLATDAAYPKADTYLTLTINPATCDCSLITWDNPTLQTKTTGLMITPVLVVALQLAVANEASKSATPAIRACYKNGGTCPLACTFTVQDKATGTLDGSNSFMVLSGNNLTITPTVSSQIGTKTLTITQIPTIRSPFTYDHVALTVTCTIIRMDVPTVPNISLTRYTVNQASALLINIAPNFTQYPPCAYVIAENLVWTIPAGAPITVTAGNKYQLKVESYNMADIKTYAVVFKDTATYLSGTWTS